MLGQIKLTQREVLILNSCKLMLQTLSQYLGPGYEIALHNLGERDDNVPIDTSNGYYMGCSKCLPLTDSELKMLDKIKTSSANQNGIIFFSQTVVGQPLRSTLLPIRGEGNRIIGLLRISFNMELPLCSLMEHLTGTTISALSGKICNSLTDNIDEVITTAIWEAREKLRTGPLSSTNRNKEIISYLDKKSIFSLKNSVDIVAKQLGLSKNTVYSYLRKPNDT